MVFSSLEFICVFLPVVFILYCLLPSLKLKNALLIIVSLGFYAYGEPVYVLLMIFSAMFNYIFAIFVDRYQDRVKLKRAMLAIAVTGNLLLLGVFKYTGFLVQSMNGLLQTDIPIPDIVLPIGISFYTFQALSYVLDVYMGTVGVQRNFFSVLLYISFFPQLIAGPIVKYRDVNEAIEDRHMEVAEVAKGFRRFICGLAKKVLLANTAGLVVDQIFAADPSSINIGVAWIGAIAYLMQIYYDFGGYSDMAIGLGRMFGFHFRENFQYPYGAHSVQDFWRRWHISLSTWFREYLYIPLGGNRKGKARACINRIIVFFLCGLWHGANWTFVIWGLWHGCFLLLESYVPFMKKLPRWISRIYTLLVVCVGFVVFRADTISDGLFMIGQMFTGFTFTEQSVSFAMQQLTPWFIIMMIVAIIGAAPIRGLSDKIRIHVESEELDRKWTVVQAGLYILSLVLLLWCMIRLSGATYNPFIYFRF